MRAGWKSEVVVKFEVSFNVCFSDIEIITYYSCIRVYTLYPIC